MTWKKAIAVAALQDKPALYKAHPKQIALFKAGGRVFAVDNRCPHEGYPLVEGHVGDGCLLTCNWHNWKFRLLDGRCVLGGDDVRSYPVQERDGFVWVNIANPPIDEIQAGLLDGLHRAFAKREYGRICREITRLYYNKLDPMLGVRKAIQWYHDRLEFGFTHALAAAADWLSLAARQRDDWEKRLICLAEVVDHMAVDALRHPRYPYAEPRDSFCSDRFLEAVEIEDREAAEGMLQSALADGICWQNLEPTFAQAALAHYNDFGHSLIYVYKTAQLLERAGDEAQQYVLPALARHLCYTTREDLLPEFKDYRRMLPDLPQPAATNGSPLTAADLFPMTTRQACSWVRENISLHKPEVLYDALLEILARNLLHFDLSYQSAFDRPVNQNIGWLDFTHGVTFANAVRNVCSKHSELWPKGLLQMACFVGRNNRFLDRGLDETRWHVADAEAFFADVESIIFDHGLRDPIFSAHVLKTAEAVREEAAGASASCRHYLLAGLNRFMNSPLKQKHARRLARQAIALVKRDME